MPSPGLDEITTTTLRARSKKLADNVGPVVDLMTALSTVAVAAKNCGLAFMGFLGSKKRGKHGTQWAIPVCFPTLALSRSGWEHCLSRGCVFGKMGRTPLRVFLTR